jgi:hypothetical protein
MHYSKLQDRLNELDKQDTDRVKKQEAWEVLHYFVTFQQCAPSSIIEKLLRSDVVAYYKQYGYNATINYLDKCIKKAKSMA